MKALLPLMLPSVPRGAFALFVSVAALAAEAPPSPPMPQFVLSWEEKPALPDHEGFAGSYAGFSHGNLIVAGGANFPAQRPWEGGTKVWYDRVFLLPRSGSVWEDAGRLPQPGGYGVSITLPEGVLLLGGMDAARCFSDAWIATLDENNRIVFTALPSLPVPLGMAAGACVGRTVFLVGGLDRPDATRALDIVIALDLDRPKNGWRNVERCPGPERFLAAVGTDGRALYLFGGARLVADNQGKTQREWLRDAYRYTPTKGWSRLADLPKPLAAAPSPMPYIEGQLLLFGGDDGTQVGVPANTHRGFSREILAFDPQALTWSRLGEVPFSLVTTPALTWDNQIVIPGGETRPGIRSPQVWSATALPQSQHPSPAARP